MGVNLRYIPAAATEDLPKRLRDAGFEVEVIREIHPSVPDIVETCLRCRRGDDVQMLCLSPADKSNEYWVIIPNAWSWWPSVHKRRVRLQHDVTTILERSGGYWPK
jgi:hypothetical protein